MSEVAKRRLASAKNLERRFSISTCASACFRSLISSIKPSIMVAPLALVKVLLIFTQRVVP
ncbi:MAG: hypothetical protein KME29_11135 [Calothrix sp. FI2-JRJ7]|nr:hypothetical protein [Calothrix sp. FI2-JRJ7]